MEQKDFELSDRMTDYLTNFCRSGDPNKAAQLPTWIASGTGQKRVMRFGEGDLRMDKPGMLKMIGTMLTNKAVGE
jgi:para-nitrobenzyl esterase